MKPNTGVTRWLVAPRWMVAQTGLLLLLLGIVAGQNLERLWQVLRPPASPVVPAQAGALAAAPAVEPATEAERAPTAARPEVPAAPARREREQVARPLTETERWITTTAHDETRRGYSVWAVLRPGGNLIIERCRAEGTAAPVCEVVLDQIIAAIDDTRIQLRNGRFFDYSLAHRDGLEMLRLSIAEDLELVPGTKSSLVNHLRNLASEVPTRGRWAGQGPRQRLARN